MKPYADLAEVQKHIVEQQFLQRVAKESEDFGDGFAAHMDEFIADEGDELQRMIDEPTGEELAMIRAELKRLLHQLDNYDIKEVWK